MLKLMLTIAGEIGEEKYPDKVIKITEIAAQKIGRLLAKNGAAALRIAVKGGGCSGMEYVIQLEKGPHVTDICFNGLIASEEQVMNFAIVIDPKSFIWINGTEIDWQVINLSPQFIFNNPNAQSSCSCGISFDPKVQR